MIKVTKFPQNADHEPFWKWVMDYDIQVDGEAGTLGEVYADWVVKGKPAGRRPLDPMKSAQWLTAFCCKWPHVEGPDTDARDHILRLIDAFVPLNEQAEKGEIDPGFWGSFAAQCQIALKDVKKQTEAQIAAIEADERYISGLKAPALVQVNAPLALIQVEMKAQHAVLTQVLEWLGQH